jgi:hypothetical protein
MAEAVLGTRGVRATRRPHHQTAVLYACYWVLLSAFVLSFVVKAGFGTRWLVGALIVGVTFLLYRRSPVHALCTLPGALMLGVIARVPLGGVGMHFGDAHLLAVTLMFLGATGLAGRIVLGTPGFAPLLAVVIVISWLFSMNVEASTITMVGLFELGLVYGLTLNLVKSDADVATLLRAWCGTITLCSLLVIISYVQGEPLILDAREGFSGTFETLKLSATTFLRASFFITSFNFPLACTLVILVVSLFLTRHSIVGGSALAIALLINLGATVLMANKTVMAAAAIASLVTLGYIARYKRFWWTLVGVTVAGMVLSKAVLHYTDRVISPQQALLFFERLGSHESFVIRLTTWKSVVAAVFASPHALLIGLGPDVSTRSGDPFFTAIFGQEHAVDSDYLFILLNYGIIVLVVYLLFFVRAFRVLLLRMVRLRHATPLLLSACMLTWLIVGITQQGGAAKTMALIVQVAAIVELIRIHRFGTDRELQAAS